MDLGMSAQLTLLPARSGQGEWGDGAWLPSGDARGQAELQPGPALP